MLLDRLELKPGDRLLEIGCGWGTLAIEAARRGAKVVGLTLSAEQKSWADEKIARSQLSDRIEIRLQDYREISEQFDAVASVEMVEAVGQRWWPAYLDSIARNLKPGGRAALQFISIDHRTVRRLFAQCRLHPGLYLPRRNVDRRAAIRGAGAGTRAELGGARRLRPRLCRNAQAMARALRRGGARGPADGFSEKFHNLWRYYLMYCEGGFRGGGIDVAQVTMVKSLGVDPIAAAGLRRRPAAVRRSPPRPLPDP